MIPMNRGYLMHGEYVKIDESHDCYVGIVKDIQDNHSEIMYFENPMVNVYVTEPSKRNYSHKREFAHKRDLMCFKTRYNKMGQTIMNALENPMGTKRPYYGFINLRKVMSSPYVYGADIDLGVRIKAAYKKANQGNSPVVFNVGSLDIETDVSGNNQILLITYMNGDGQTYVGILKEFLKNHTTDEVEKMWSAKIEPKFHASLNEKSKKVYEKNPPITLHMEVFERESALIKWVFDRIHECKPDFCVIWNMGYDIPYIIDRLAFRGINPKDIFCHPDIPSKYRICEYKNDTKKVDHIVDRWDWFKLTDYTRYIDAMALYGRLRKAKAREPSYRLDAIGGKEIGTGKLEFGDGEGHLEMQSKHPVEYTVYNIVDVAILHVMNLKNSDVKNLLMLTDISNLADFNKQSVMLKNSFYEYLEEKDCVPGSMGEPLGDSWDKWITNKGGAVLDTTRTFDSGIPILKESDIVSMVHKVVCDIDVSSDYPHQVIMQNNSRETLLAGILSIDNSGRIGPVESDDVKLEGEAAEGILNYQTFEVESFLADAIFTDANAVNVGHTFFGLPNYAEMSKIVEERLKSSIL